jgi:predicted dehydrogenase
VRQLIQDLRSGRVEVVEVPDPEARRGEVLVSTRFSLISPGTEGAISRTAKRSLVGKALDRPDQARQVLDKAVRDGVGPTLAAVRARLDDVLTPGYSSSGVIEAVGGGVEGLAAGDRVACVGANVACHAERVTVPAPLCLRLPDELDERVGAFAALGAIAGHGVRLAEADAGSLVVVVGLGLVGQIAAQLVSAAGGRAVGIDTSVDRVELARRLGAREAFVLGEEGLEDRVRDLSGGYGADAVVVCAATDDSGPVELAAALARDRATVSVVGAVGLDVPRAPFYEKELQLRVSRSYGPGRYDPAYEEGGHDYPIGYVRWTERRLIAYFLEEAAAGPLRLEELVSHEFAIEQGEEAYTALEDAGRLGILLRYDRAPAPVRRTEVGGARLHAGRTGGPGERLRVGLVGPGLFARQTLVPLLSKMDGVDLGTVAGGSPARSLGVARRFNFQSAAAGAEEVVEDDAIEVLVVATRHDSHAELVARGLERGKGVFCEKPLAIDDAGVARVRPALAGGRLVVDFNRSLAPATEQVAAHFFGRREPIAITVRVNAGFLAPDHWLRDPARGGGRLVGEGCHFVDLCSCLVGVAVTSVSVRSLASGPRTLAGDNWLLTLAYADGSLASITYISSGDAGLAKERVEVLGGGRAAVIDDFRNVELYASGRKRRRPLDLHNARAALRFQDKGHEATLRAAMRFFREGGPPPLPDHRLLETTEVTLRARDALTAGDEGPFALAAQ